MSTLVAGIGSREGVEEGHTSWGGNAGREADDGVAGGYLRHHSREQGRGRRYLAPG